MKRPEKYTFPTIREHLKEKDERPMREKIEAMRRLLDQWYASRKKGMLG